MGRSFLLLRTLTPGGVEGKRFDRAFALKSAFIAPLVIFTLTAVIAAQPQLVPHPPFTQMPFVSLPMAVLAVAFIHRPLVEHPVYAAVYLAIRLQFADSAQWPFIVVLALIEVAQTAVYVAVMWRFYPKFT